MEINKYKVYHKKLKCFLDDNTTNKKLINYFSLNNQYDYTYFIINDFDFEKFLKKHGYIFNHIELVSTETSLENYIIFNLSENDIKFICESFKIFNFGRYFLGNKIKYFEYKKTEKKFIEQQPENEGLTEN